MKIAVLTSGGDAPGMNAAIQAVVKAGRSRGHDVVGVERGYEGLLQGAIRTLSVQDVDDVARFGGTFLGSARCLAFPTDAGQQQAKSVLEKHAIDALFVVGGNGSLTGAHRLSSITKTQIIGAPASIDNDVGHTQLAIGVDTAVNTIVDACDRICDTATAHRRAFLVEVMGRQCGYLAMRAGIAAGADAILFAEKEMAPDDMVKRLLALLSRSFSSERHKKRVLIIKAEGVSMPTHELTEALREGAHAIDPTIGVRATVLGHVVRGGKPSATDRVIAKRFGFGAVLAAEGGHSDIMLAWEPRGDPGLPTKDSSVRIVPLDEVLRETESLLSGTSPITAGRIKLLSEAEGILAI